ncbi:unnamed protein product [Rhodiola kirilowii]
MTSTPSHPIFSQPICVYLIAQIFDDDLSIGSNQITSLTSSGLQSINLVVDIFFMRYLLRQVRQVVSNSGKEIFE